MPEKEQKAPAAVLMSDEAISVCQLLAIDPEDIMPRDISEFQDPGNKVSQQRLQLRQGYYEEKRQLKVKAIENILIKTQTTKSGQTSMEGQQVLTLLNDIKSIQTPNKRNLYMSMNSGSDSPTWKFMDSSPHSPGRKPFIGGAR